MSKSLTYTKIGQKFVDKFKDTVLRRSQVRAEIMSKKGRQEPTTICGIGVSIGKHHDKSRQNVMPNEGIETYDQKGRRQVISKGVVKKRGAGANPPLESFLGACHAAPPEGKTSRSVSGWFVIGSRDVRSSMTRLPWSSRLAK